MSNSYKLPIIVDLGSSEIKAGFSGEDFPKVRFPNIIGDLKNKKSHNLFKNVQKNMYVGEECENLLDNLDIRYAINKGIFPNEDDIFTIFNHMYKKLGINSEQEIKEHPLLISEPLLNSESNREKIANVLFEKMNVNSLIFGKQPLLSLFSTSSTFGIILESGDAITQSCVSYEGYSIPLSYLRYDFGGREVTQTLKKLLNRDRINPFSLNDFHLFNAIKESQCYFQIKDKKENLNDENVIDENVKDENDENDEKKNIATNYILPDGNSIELKDEKILAPEILINPLFIGSENLSFQEMINNSINKVDINIRTKLYDSIFLSGGNTIFKGMTNILSSKLTELAPKGVKISINTSKNPQLSCWVGGNIISSLSSFNKMLVNKKDWDSDKNVLHTHTI